jgi:hypothetical protein
MSDERLLAGPILGFVGGLLILIDGAIETFVGAQGLSLASSAGFSLGPAETVLASGVAGIVLGLLIIVCSAALAVYSEYHGTLGVLIILFSVLSLVSLGGWIGPGLLLGVLGGTCGVVFGPEEVPISPSKRLPTPEPPLTVPVDEFGRSHRACVACGRVSPISVKICPGCGKELLNSPEEARHT